MIDPQLLWLSFMILLIFLIVISRLEIAFSIAFVGLLWAMVADRSLVFATSRIFSGLDHFVFLAVPFFLLLGEFMNRSGMIRHIFDVANMLVGRFRGGLAQANVVASLLFSGITGAAIADIAAIGSIFIPSMYEEGYGKDFSAAVTAASALVGPIIPPSVILVIYGAVTATSIGGLFAAALIPGIVLGILLMIIVFFISIRQDLPRYEEHVERSEYPVLIFHAFIAFTIPAIILIGIFGGFVTPTEAAGIASIYALIVGILVYNLNIPNIIGALDQTAVRTAQVFIIIGFASVLSWILAREGIPALLASGFEEAELGIIGFLLAISIMLLFIGTWLEGAAAVILLGPTLAETASIIGVHELHFGIVFTLWLNFGLITPPIGVGLFVASAVSDTPVWPIIRQIVPFYIAYVAFFTLLIFIPQLTLYVPRMLGFA